MWLTTEATISICLTHLSERIVSHQQHRMTKGKAVGGNMTRRVRQASSLSPYFSPHSARELHCVCFVSVRCANWRARKMMAKDEQYCKPVGLLALSLARSHCRIISYSIRLPAGETTHRTMLVHGTDAVIRHKTGHKVSIVLSPVVEREPLSLSIYFCRNQARIGLKYFTGRTVGLN